MGKKSKLVSFCIISDPIMQINKHFSFRISVIKDISKSDSISQLLIRNRTTDPTKSKEDLSPSVPDTGKIRQGGWCGNDFS